MLTEEHEALINVAKRMKCPNAEQLSVLELSEWIANKDRPGLELRKAQQQENRFIKENREEDNSFDRFQFDDCSILPWASKTDFEKNPELAAEFDSIKRGL